jgi:hypothetical protein
MRQQAIHGPAGLTAPAFTREGGTDNESVRRDSGSETGGNEKRQRWAAGTAEKGVIGEDLLLSMSTMVSESVSESVGARMEQIMEVGGGCGIALCDWFDDLLRSDGSQCHNECLPHFFSK